MLQHGRLAALLWVCQIVMLCVFAKGARWVLSPARWKLSAIAVVQMAALLARASKRSAQGIVQYATLCWVYLVGGGPEGMQAFVDVLSHPGGRHAVDRARHRLFARLARGLPEWDGFVRGTTYWAQFATDVAELGLVLAAFLTECVAGEISLSAYSMLYSLCVQTAPRRAAPGRG